MLSRVGQRFSRVIGAFVPDPFVIAVLLTVVVALAAVIKVWTTGGATAVPDLWRGWGGDDGVWRLLAFTTQMALILMTGATLAAAPPVARGLRTLAGVPRTARGAAALVAIVAMSAGLLNWGLGLIVGAVLARDVGASLRARGIPHHYPVLAAAGYTGLLVWHGGLSGSAPLSVTTEAQIARVLPEGYSLAPIGLGETVLSPMNLVITGGVVLIATIMFAFLMPARGGTPAPARGDIARAKSAAPEHAEGGDERGRAVRVLEDSRLVPLTLGMLVLLWAIAYVLGEAGSTGAVRFALTPNEINLAMLGLGLLLHRSARGFVSAIEDSARGAAGVLLQFPLYAGIMGLMATSGLTADLARLVAAVASERTLPAWTFINAGVVNLFVPSGGGQWSVQGPIAIASAAELQTPLPKMVMAVAYGDQLTNMLQPFWALPLLAITGVRARDIVGYTALVMLAASGWILVNLLLW